MVAQDGLVYAHSYANTAPSQEFLDYWFLQL